MAWSTAKASGEAIVTTLPLVTMKDTTRMGKRMAMASIDGPQATYIKVNFWMTSARAMERCTGLMAVATSVSGLIQYSMAMEGWSFLVSLTKKVTLITTFSKDLKQSPTHKVTNYGAMLVWSDPKKLTIPVNQLTSMKLNRVVLNRGTPQCLNRINI